MSRSPKEYEAARFLYDEYDVVSFPAPIQTYDLLTLDGIRIEVKHTQERKTYKRAWHFNSYTIVQNKKFSFANTQLTESQLKPNALDLFMIKVGNTWVFIPQGQILSSSLPGRISAEYITKALTQKFETWQDIIDLLVGPTWDRFETLKAYQLT